MSPLAEPAAATGAALVPEDLLADGEEVILAVKPSVWFPLLVSLPVLTLAALVAAAALVASRFFGNRGALEAVVWLCAAAGCLRVVVGCFQWLAKLYVLTSRRLLSVHGISRLEVIQLPLRDVRRTELTVSTCERLVGAGTLVFQADGEGHDSDQTAWVSVAEPREVERIVNEAVRQAR